MQIDRTTSVGNVQLIFIVSFVSFASLARRSAVAFSLASAVVRTE